MSSFMSKLSNLFSGPQPPKMAIPFSIPSSDKTPAQVESEWLQELRSFIAQLTSQMTQLQSAAPLLGYWGTKSITDYLSVAIPNLEAFTPKAEWLDKAGLKQMSSGLTAVLGDTKKAYDIHLKTLAGWVQNNAQNAKIMGESDRATTETILETNRKAQEAYDRANQNW
jgi:hypothetical protein